MREGQRDRGREREREVVQIHTERHKTTRKHEHDEPTLHSTQSGQR